MLKDMKAVKMLGLSDVMSDIYTLQTHDVKDSPSYRNHISMLLLFLPFAVYAVIAVFWNN
ncbi:hypothetical protein QQZ08_004069 [Neonectria magnoliae]|uniref:Uncharacterized protein n=1 Tax=Neonectria magnoliae TaxID=2732573 RepID=A0ABR1I7C7_9HYPO